MRKIGLLVFLFLISSCAFLQPRPPVKPIEAKEFWAVFWRNQTRKKLETQAIQGKIRLDMAEKKQTLSGTGTLYSSPEGLRLELRDPLGRLQYAAVLDGKKFFLAYYPSQNRAYSDKAQGGIYLREFLGLGMSFYDLKDLWLGILPFKRSELQLESVEKTDREGQLLAVLKKGKLQIDALVDSTTGEILNLEWKNFDFKANFEFSEFAKCCEEYTTQNELPRVGRSVFLKIENQASELDLEWVEIVPPSEKGKGIFSLELPGSVRKIILR